MHDSDFESCDSEHENLAQAARPPDKKQVKISGTARVTRVTPKFAYISSEKHGSIFMLPKCVSHHFMNPNTFIDLAIFLRVDEIVHFTAVSQTNAQNNCQWLAVKVTKVSSNSSQLKISGDCPVTSSGAKNRREKAHAKTAENGQPTSKNGAACGGARANDLHTLSDNVAEISDDDDENASIFSQNSKGNGDDLLRNVQGVIFDVHEKFGYLMTRDLGRVYLPLAACFCGPDEHKASEFQKLSDSFLLDDVLVFDACRQPEKNGCRYAVKRVKHIVEEPEARRLLHSLLLSETHLPPTGQSSPVSHCSSGSATDVAAVAPIAAPSLCGPLRVGEVYKLCPQFGFIKSHPLGNVYFTLSNYAGFADASQNCAIEAPSLALPDSLLDVLTIGDRVHFWPSSQPEKNGCKWRACRVQKLPSDPTILVDCSAIDVASKNYAIDVSSQTDQNLWNSFLAAQAVPSRRRSTDVASQTTTPPEIMLLNALRSNADFKQNLTERFPHLMRYIDKNT